MENQVQLKIKELAFFMERLIVLHQNLINLLREEYSHMGNLDTPSLLETTRSKESMINEIWNNEQLRIKTTHELGVLLKISEKSFNLKTLSGFLPHPENQRLIKLGEILQVAIQRAKDLNTQNMVLAESSMLRLEEMKRNVLGLNNNNSKENYSQSGSRINVSEQGGRLLSTEA